MSEQQLYFSPDSPTAVWSRAVASAPLNNGSVLGEGESPLAALLASFSGASPLAAFVGAHMAEKAIVFALTEAPLVIPIPLLLLAEDGDSTTFSASASYRVPTRPSAALVAALRGIGIVSEEEKAELEAAEEPTEEEGANSFVARGSFTVAIFDAKLDTTPKGLSAATDGDEGSSPLLIPYLLVTLGGTVSMATGEECLPTAPLLLRLLTVVLSFMNAPAGRSAIAAALALPPSASLAAAHAVRASLAAMARVLYCEYSVSILSMKRVGGFGNGDGDDDEAADGDSDEAPTAHPLEASDIDAWTPMLMAALLHGSTAAAPTAPTASTTNDDADGVDSSAPSYAILTPAEAEAFIHNFMTFHGLYGPVVAAYVADLATFTQSTATALLSLREEAEGSGEGSGVPISINPEAVRAFLRVFPLSSSSSAAAASETKEGHQLCPRILSLTGGGIPSSSSASAFVIVDDTIDASLATYCGRLLSDEAAADGFWIPFAGVEDAGATCSDAYHLPAFALKAEVLDDIAPAVAAAVVKRFGRHLLHGPRSDDFTDCVASADNGECEADTAVLSGDVGMAIDTVYDNTAGAGLRVAAILSAAEPLFRGLLWEALVAFANGLIARDSGNAAGALSKALTVAGTDVISLSTVLSGGVAAPMAVPSSSAVTTQRTFKALCDRFARNIAAHPSAPLRLLASADDAGLMAICKNTADMLVRLSDAIVPKPKAAMPGNATANGAPVYAVAARYALPATVNALLRLVASAVAIAPAVGASFPSPSAGGYSPADPVTAPRAVSASATAGTEKGKKTDTAASDDEEEEEEEISVRRNVHEIIFDRLMTAQGALFTPLYIAADSDEDKEEGSTAKKKSANVPTHVNDYADVCAAHYTLSLLRARSGASSASKKADALIASVVAPLHILPHHQQQGEAGEEAAHTAPQFPAPLSPTVVAAMGPAYAAYLLHFITLHSNAQSGAKNSFLVTAAVAAAKCGVRRGGTGPKAFAEGAEGGVKRSKKSASPVTYSPVVSSPASSSHSSVFAFARSLRPELVAPPVVRSLLSLSPSSEGYVTVFESPFVKSRRVCLRHLYLMDSGATEDAAEDTSAANPNGAFKGLADAELIVVGSPTVAEQSPSAASDDNDDGDATTPKPLDYLWLPQKKAAEVKKSTVAPTGVAFSSSKTAVASPTLAKAAQSLLAAPHRSAAHVLLASPHHAGLGLASPSSPAAGNADSEEEAFVDLFKLVRDFDGQLEEAECEVPNGFGHASARAAVGPLAAVYALINALQMPSVPIAVPTRVAMASSGRGGVPNYSALFTDLRHEDLLSTAVSSHTAAGTGGTSESSAVATVAALTSLLNSEAIARYILTAPETHADRFHELYSRNAFREADDKKQIGGDGADAAEKEKGRARQRAKRRRGRGDGEDGSDDDSDDDGDEEGTATGSGSGANSGNKKFKTRLDMLYDAVLAPMTLYERRLEASAFSSSSSPSSSSSLLRCSANAAEGGFALSPWLVLWYKFFVALAANAERRMVAADARNSAVILATAATEANATSGLPADVAANVAAASAQQQKAKKTATAAVAVGVPDDILHCIVDIVEELQTLCPALVLTTTEGRAEAAEKQRRAEAKQKSNGGGDGEEAEEEEEPIEEQFAAAQKAFGRAADKYNNDVKLRFYGLFKQATVGDVNISRPWGMDVAGKAKYDAWAALKGTAKEAAVRAYVDEWAKLRRSGGPR